MKNSDLITKSSEDVRTTKIQINKIVNKSHRIIGIVIKHNLINKEESQYGQKEVVKPLSNNLYKQVRKK